MSQLGAVLAVLEFLVDVVQLEVPLVNDTGDARLQVVLQGLLSDAARGLIQTLQNLIHAIRAMHNQQVLVDRVKIVLIKRLDQLDVSVKILNTELFVWVFVLLHENAVFNLLVPLSLLEIPW